jgi:hypothetical protein
MELEYVRKGRITARLKFREVLSFSSQQSGGEGTAGCISARREQTFCYRHTDLPAQQEQL